MDMGGNWLSAMYPSRDQRGRTYHRDRCMGGTLPVLPQGPQRLPDLGPCGLGAL